MLNMSSALLEFIDLASDDAPFTSNERFPIPFSMAGIDLSDQDYPLYVIPEISETDARGMLNQFPDEAVTYLLVAKSIWETDADQARQLVLDGFTYAENETRYLASAAFIADEASDQGAGILLAIFAWQKSLSELTEDDYEDFRPLIGSYIYDATGNIETLNYQALVDTFADVENYQALNLDTSNMSMPTAFAIIHNYIERGGVRLEVIANRYAENAFDRMLADPRFEAEGLLLLGEYELLNDDPAAAERAWNSILDLENTPDWIEDRADELLNQLPTEED